MNPHHSISKTTDGVHTSMMGYFETLGERVPTYPIERSFWERAWIFLNLDVKILWRWVRTYYQRLKAGPWRNVH